jgi:acyl-CoA hydrolase
MQGEHMTEPKALYRQKLLSISEAVGLVQSGQTICVAMAAAEPPGLLTELGRHWQRLENVTVWVCLPLRLYDFIYKPEMSSHFFVENWFYGAPDRKVHAEGRTFYIPNNLHRAARVKLEATRHLDIFWGTATPPDRHGYMSLSLNLIYEKEMIEAADLVVLEINENLPWTLGDTQIHLSEVDYIVENHVPLFEMPPVPPTPAEEAIGGYIAELIEDGATIQLGIGGIPNAIASFLMERRDLGVHTEMFTDGMVDLFEAGVITGRKKSIWKGKMVGAFALGTNKLYRFLHNNLAVEFQRGKVTNAPHVVGRNYKMVSVNTAIQVDLGGQVCSQSIGVRHFSGTGGQLDTHRGAQYSPGGRGIIALRATAKDGTISTIVPMLDPGAEVTVPGQDVDTIVTEYGVAELKGRCVKDRVKALSSIAAPEFRPWLQEEAELLGIVPRLVIPAIKVEEKPAHVVAQPRPRQEPPGITADTVRLGTLADLSGPNAHIGLACYRGYSAYYRYINHWGGVHGRRIELIVEDTSFDLTRAKLAAIKLVQHDQVFAIVSPLGTSVNLTVLDYFLEKQVPVISPHSGASVWSIPPKRTYFALQPNYQMEGCLLAQYALNKLGTKRVALFSVDDLFGQEGSTAFIKELRRAGHEPVAHVIHSPHEVSSTDWLKTLRTAQPDLVVLYSYVKPAADLLVEAHQHGFRPLWLGSYVLSGPDMFLLAGAAAVEGRG